MLASLGQRSTAGPGAQAPHSGQCLATAAVRPATMPALMLNRSSRDMPGLRGTPEGLGAFGTHTQGGRGWGCGARGGGRARATARQQQGGMRLSHTRGDIHVRVKLRHARTRGDDHQRGASQRCRQLLRALQPVASGAAAREVSLRQRPCQLALEQPSSCFSGARLSGPGAAHLMRADERGGAHMRHVGSHAGHRGSHVVESQLRDVGRHLRRACRRFMGGLGLLLGCGLL
jgi:hypothetical protein